MMQFSELAEDVSDVQIIALCLAKISQYLGVKMAIVHGGPCASDPCGEVQEFVSFRDSHGNAFAIGIDEAKRIRPINSKHPKA